MDKVRAGEAVGSKEVCILRFRLRTPYTISATAYALPTRSPLPPTHSLRDLRYRLRNMSPCVCVCVCVCVCHRGARRSLTAAPSALRHAHTHRDRQTDTHTPWHRHRRADRRADRQRLTATRAGGAGGAERPGGAGGAAREGGPPRR
eukprot:3179497-Rhodomonas_salina.1